MASSSNTDNQDAEKNAGSPNANVVKTVQEEYEELLKLGRCLDSDWKDRNYHPCLLDCASPELLAKCKEEMRKLGFEYNEPREICDFPTSSGTNINMTTSGGNNLPTSSRTNINTGSSGGASKPTPSGTNINMKYGDSPNNFSPQSHPTGADGASNNQPFGETETNSAFADPLGTSRDIGRKPLPSMMKIGGKDGLSVNDECRTEEDPTPCKDPECPWEWAKNYHPCNNTVNAHDAELCRKWIKEQGIVASQRILGHPVGLHKMESSTTTTTPSEIGNMLETVQDAIGGAQVGLAQDRTLIVKGETDDDSEGLVLCAPDVPFSEMAEEDVKKLVKELIWTIRGHDHHE